MSTDEENSLPSEVFLSHSSHDREFTRNLANVLRRHRVPVWFSEVNILGAQQWHDEIGRALRRSDWFVLILSPNAVASKWVKRELVYALSDDRFENHIVPVLYKSCDHEELSWTLSQIQMVDFGTDLNMGFEKLLAIWNIKYETRESL